MSEIKTIPIVFGSVTLVGYLTKKYPISGGNCFSLKDTDGKYHSVVNFGYENLKEHMRLTNQKDIRVRCIPKSDDIWEICDERIPSDWYKKDYCTVCTPLRMLPLEQRKREMSCSKYRKVYDENDKSKWWLLISRELKSSSSVPLGKGIHTLSEGAAYAPYIPKYKDLKFTVESEQDLQSAFYEKLVIQPDPYKKD